MASCKIQKENIEKWLKEERKVNKRKLGILEMRLKEGKRKRKRGRIRKEKGQ